jgi:hypothetical protein
MSSLTAPPPTPGIIHKFYCQKERAEYPRHPPCNKQGSDTMDINQKIFEEYTDDLGHEKVIHIYEPFSKIGI